MGISSILSVYMSSVISLAYCFSNVVVGTLSFSITHVISNGIVIVRLPFIVICIIKT